MPNYTAVIDLETIPDRAIWTPPEPEPALDPTKCEKCGLALTPEENKVRKCTKMERGKCRLPPERTAEEKSPFPPPHAHQICVIGFALLEDDMPVNIASVTASVPQEERTLLEQFNGFMVQNNPTVVTWNGRHFDLHVLQLRSLRHGVAQAWYGRQHANRYAEEGHIDLCDVLGNHGPKGITLDEAARVIGLPGKNGFDGSMVADTVAAGGIETVQNYCMTDVVQTTYLYLRYRLLRGALTPEAYRKACEALKAQWEGLPAFKDWTAGNVDLGRLELW